MNTEKILYRYFSEYAEPEIHQLPLWDTIYDHAVCIPIYDEAFSQIINVIPALAPNTLLILIINTPAHRPNLEAEQRTIELLRQIKQQWPLLQSPVHPSSLLQSPLRNEPKHSQQSFTNYPPAQRNDPLCLLHLDEKRQVDALVVDKTIHFGGIPKKQGVGLARKIGVDIASYLYHQDRIRSPWVHSTDADVYLPSPYPCSEISMVTDDDTAACIYPFQHIPVQHLPIQHSPIQHSSIQHSSIQHSPMNKHEIFQQDDKALIWASRLYDFKMAHYMLGLQWAKSPYAFYSLGSTIAVHATYYCAVGGFPRRSGGEDFYLLNKLAKVGKIQNLSSSPIKIQARLSQRVPFGTGPALTTLSQLASSDLQSLAQHPYFYHPKSFLLLKSLIHYLKNLWQVEERKQPQHIDLTALNQYLELQHIELSPQDQQSLSIALKTLDIESQLLPHQKQCRSQRVWEQSVNQWLDGFRTLKFIHLLRDHGLPSLSLIEWVSSQQILPPELQQTFDSMFHSLGLQDLLPRS